MPGHYAQLAAGDQFSLALTADGQLYAWGENGTGQLGNGTKQSYFNDDDHPVPTATP